MRILHTSDWHLGRGLHGTNLHDAQKAALEQILAIAEQSAVDVVVIAGDIYDRGIPPLESVGLLNRTLSRLCATVPVIVTAGNHDSPTRLGFGAELFGAGLHMRTRIDEVAEPVILHDEHGPVAFYALTYLDPDEARHVLSDGEAPLERTHESVMQAAVDRVRSDARSRGITRTVAIAHAFVVGGDRSDAETSESERDITVGTVDCLPSEVFDGLSYVALGHLHGRQKPRATSSGTILEYSGSPLRYSFSEEKQQKSVTIVEVDAAGAVTTRAEPITQPRGMARIRGPIDELCATDGPFATHREDWVQVTVTDQMRPENMIQRLASAFPHSLIKRHEPPNPLSARGIGVVASTAASPREVLAGFLAEVTGAAPEEHELLSIEPLIKTAFEGKK